MVDAIAAGQNLVGAPESILQALDDLIADAQSYPVADTETAVDEPLASAQFDAVPSLDEQVDIDTEISLPLIEEVDYQEVVDDERSDTVELAEEDALTAADSLLADSPLVERIAADVTQESQVFAVLELDESAESDGEDITLSAMDLGDELLVDQLAVEDIVPTLPVAEIIDDVDADYVEDISFALP
jgi:hypothetical protein